MKDDYDHHGQRECCQDDDSELFEFLDVLILIFTEIETIKRKVNKLMATQAELAASLRDLNTQVEKVAAEITGLIQKVSDLEALVAAGGLVTPEVQQGFDAVKASLQKADDLVPDPVPVPPAP